MYKQLGKILFIFWAVILFFIGRELFLLQSLNQDAGVITLIHLLVEKVRLITSGNYPLTLFIVIMLFIVRPLFFFPATALVLATVIIFGPYIGFCISYIGDSIAASFAYYLGSYFGTVFGLAKKDSKNSIALYFKNNQLLGLALLRFIPLFSFDFVSYSSGILKIPFKTYMFGTLLGMIPGLAAFIFISSSFQYKERIPLAILIAILLVGAAMLIKKYSKRTSVHLDV